VLLEQSNLKVDMIVGRKRIVKGFFSDQKGVKVYKKKRTFWKGQTMGQKLYAKKPKEGW